MNRLFVHVLGIEERLLNQIPLRRFGKAEKVAQIVVFLCALEGDYVTGAELEVNGGLFM